MKVSAAVDEKTIRSCKYTAQTVIVIKSLIFIILGKQKKIFLNLVMCTKINDD